MSTKAKAHGHQVKGQQRQGSGRTGQVSPKHHSSKKARRTKARALDNAKHAAGSKSAAAGRAASEAYIAATHGKPGAVFKTGTRNGKKRPSESMNPTGTSAPKRRAMSW